MTTGAIARLRRIARDGSRNAMKNEEFGQPVIAKNEEFGRPVVAKASDAGAWSQGRTVTLTLTVDRVATARDIAVHLAYHIGRGELRLEAAIDDPT
jgi:hypothetical protein